jgi:hypothetical protein
LPFALITRSRYGTIGPGGTAVTITVASGSDTNADAGYTIDAAVADGGWKALLHPTSAGGDYIITATCTGCMWTDFFRSSSLDPPPPRDLFCS